MEGTVANGFISRSKLYIAWIISHLLLLPIYLLNSELNLILCIEFNGPLVPDQ